MHILLCLGIFGQYNRNYEVNDISILSPFPCRLLPRLYLAMDLIEISYV